MISLRSQSNIIASTTVHHLGYTAEVGIIALQLAHLHRGALQAAAGRGKLGHERVARSLLRGSGGGGVIEKVAAAAASSRNSSKRSGQAQPCNNTPGIGPTRAGQCYSNITGAVVQGSVSGTPRTWAVQLPTRVCRMGRSTSSLTLSSVCIFWPSAAERKRPHTCSHMGGIGGWGNRGLGPRRVLSGECTAERQCRGGWEVGMALVGKVDSSCSRPMSRSA